MVKLHKLSALILGIMSIAILSALWYTYIIKERNTTAGRAESTRYRKQYTCEDGYFRSDQERAYRCEAIREMFCGLHREGQDKVLRLAMELLIGQNSQGIGVKSEIVVKGGVA